MMCSWTCRVVGWIIWMVSNCEEDWLSMWNSLTNLVSYLSPSDTMLVFRIHGELHVFAILEQDVKNVLPRQSLLLIVWHLSSLSAPDRFHIWELAEKVHWLWRIEIVCPVLSGWAKKMYHIICHRSMFYSYIEHDSRSEIVVWPASFPLTVTVFKVHEECTETLN